MGKAQSLAGSDGAMRWGGGAGMGWQWNPSSGIPSASPASGHRERDMWPLVAPVTGTIPWEHPGTHSSLPAASVPPGAPSCLFWEQHRGCAGRALVLPVAGCAIQAALSLTEHSRSSSRSLGKWTTAPPAALPGSTAFPPTESPGWPCCQLCCHHGAWVRGSCGSSGCGSILGEILVFHRCFCPQGTFLAAFPPTPHVLTARPQSPCSGSIPSHGPPSWRRVLGSTVLHRRHLHPHRPPARSQRPQPCSGVGWLSMPSFAPALILWG